MSDLGTLRVERRDRVTTVRLHRPDRMNAVNEAMYRELAGVLDQAAADPGVGALVLTGSVRERDGVRRQAFCAGADLKDHDAGRRTRAQQRAYIELAHDTARRLYEHPKPVVVAVNGAARGAGAELVLCCDLVLVADDATIAFPETGLGTMVGGGATWHLPRLVGLARAKELVLTGRVLDGGQAVAIGLALRSVPVAGLDAAALELAAALAARAPRSMAFAKEQLQRSAGRDLDTALRLEAEAILACMETADWREGARAFVERRPPEFTGE